jgi:hypothetical protein
MPSTTFSTLTAVAALASMPLCASGLQATYAEPDDLAQPADSLEARVWLDRGEEPVVHPGDEVRVYYRTSTDAFAAIFRIDTDGRISLVFPQHPDVDPYVGGGRDYRLLFPDGPRWEVREDPGMGYFFMVASPVPLDFSAIGFDADSGWDLSGVAETVYEDPYVAIDEYVAVILPGWEATPYALDFLSYSVGEEQEYPRFLCYDCHGFRSYASWNPYADLCSSYQVVVWNDPYFMPRYRYAGTRVVFARPFGPRPRFAVTVRSSFARGPIVRTRPAPPPRITAFKESPRTPPLRRPSAVVPERGRGSARSAPIVRAPVGAAPNRAMPGRENPSRVMPRRVPPDRAASDRATRDRVRPDRPTLLRRAPSGRPTRPSAAGRAPGADRERPIVRTPPRGTSPDRARPGAAPPRRPPPSGARSRVPPARSPAGVRSSGRPARVTPRPTRSPTGVAPNRNPAPARARPAPPSAARGRPAPSTARPRTGPPSPRQGERPSGARRSPDRPSGGSGAPRPSRPDGRDD